MPEELGQMLATGEGGGRVKIGPPRSKYKTPMFMPRYEEISLPLIGMKMVEGCEMLLRREWLLPTSPPHKSSPVNVSVKNTKGVE